MIAQLRGTVIAGEPGAVMLDVNGLGFRVHLPAAAHERLPAVGHQAILHTHLHVQEDAFTLYGFPERSMLEFFELLLTVSGIGPRVALGLVGAISSRDFYWEVAQGNVPALVRLPGIGRKTAQRILLELKDKVGGLPPSQAEVLPLTSEVFSPGCEALMALGYTYAEAEGAVRRALQELDGDDTDIQRVVERAIRRLVRR